MGDFGASSSIGGMATDFPEFLANHKGQPDQDVLADRREPSEEAKASIADELGHSDASSGGTKKGKGRKDAGATGAPKITERRKQQNRAAQKSFRERKDRHLKELEEKVAAQDELNAYANSLIQRLQAENDALRGLLGHARLKPSQRMTEAGWTPPPGVQKYSPPLYTGTGPSPLDLPPRAGSFSYDQQSSVVFPNQHANVQTNDLFAYSPGPRRSPVQSTSAGPSMPGVVAYQRGNPDYGRPQSPSSASRISGQPQHAYSDANHAPLLHDSCDVPTAWYRLSKDPAFATCDQTALAAELHQLSRPQYGRHAEVAAHDLERLMISMRNQGNLAR